MRKQVWVGLTVLLMVAVLAALAACGGTAQGATPGTGGGQAATPTASSGGSKETPAALDGQALVQERCVMCHDLGRVQQAKKTQDVWKTTVERMVGKGAQLTQAEQDAVIAYLGKTYAQ
jgi:cytochrome c5